VNFLAEVCYFCISYVFGLTLCCVVRCELIVTADSMTFVLCAWLFAFFATPAADTILTSSYRTARYKTFYIEQPVSINVIFMLF